MRPEKASNGLTFVEREAKLPEAGEQLGLNGSVNRVIHALVGGRLDPAISSTYHDDLGYFPAVVVLRRKHAMLAVTHRKWQYTMAMKPGWSSSL